MSKTGCHMIDEKERCCEDTSLNRVMHEYANFVSCGSPDGARLLLVSVNSCAQN